MFSCGAEKKSGFWDRHTVILQTEAVRFFASQRNPPVFPIKQFVFFSRDNIIPVCSRRIYDSVNFNLFPEIYSYISVTDFTGIESVNIPVTYFGELFRRLVFI